MAGAGPPHTVRHPEIVMKRTDQPEPTNTPAPSTPGTDDTTTEHRPPAPSPAEHNATVQQARDAGTLPRHW
jgi:hypothetical protein